jgi:hypothetical protein
MTQRNRSARSRARRLAVEALEARDCPACTVFQIGGTVHVLGDGTANMVIIDELPTSPFPPHLPGSLRIIADGVVTEFPTATVKRLDVQTRGGDDVVLYKSVIAPGADGVSSLSISLGAGNDVADVTVTRRTAAPPVYAGSWWLTVDGSAGDDAVVTHFGRIDFNSVRIQANLGAGNDSFAAEFDGPIAAANGKPTLIRLNVLGGLGDDAMNLDAVAEAEMADLSAVLQGGDGNDHITMAAAFSGTTPSRARLQALGGAGNDIVAVNLASTTPPGAYSNSVLIRGGSGNDELSFDGLQSVVCNAVIDGGADFDIGAIAGLTARLRNCESVTTRSVPR